MKQLMLSLFLFTSLYVAAQNNAANKNLDLNIIGNLVADKATVSEVTDKFGQATDELARPQSTLLHYELNDKEYLFKFDEKRKLEECIFSNDSKNLPDNLRYTDVKKARDFKTKAEIKAVLGEPTKAIINSGNETWYYTVGDDTEPEKTLIVSFDPSAPTLVKSYNYYADSDSVKAFSPDVINSLVKGTTNSTDIEKKLGKPSKIILNNKSEDWYYTSKNSTLIVYFDKQSVVNDFLYHRTSEQAN